MIGGGISPVSTNIFPLWSLDVPTVTPNRKIIRAIQAKISCRNFHLITSSEFLRLRYFGILNKSFYKYILLRQGNKQLTLGRIISKYPQICLSPAIEVITL